MKSRTLVALGIAAGLAMACGEDREDTMVGLEPGDAGSCSGDGDSAGDDGSGAGSDEDGGGDGPNFDLNAMPDSEGADCSAADGTVDFSNIWIANSSEGTVSKVNTFTGDEEGRYRTGPTNADPSRTSVNLYGDAAVVNRGPGGIAKIAARKTDCIDRNGDGTIQTSTGPGDVLAWDEDECVLWYRDVPSPNSYNEGPRPVAWEIEQPDADGCLPNEARVWVGWYSGTTDNVAYFRRLDGATGDVLDEVEVPDFKGAPDDHWEAWGGPYGGAIDPNNDFWVTGKPGTVVRIPHDDPQGWQIWREPVGAAFYGMALDPNGHAWITDWDGYVHHFDPDTETFETLSVGGLLRGVQVDRDGIAWIARNFDCALARIDTQTSTVLGPVPIPGCSMPVGISIDYEGYVWAVDSGTSSAFKIDPQTHQVMLEAGGLVSPYTYSDMTGFGLRLSANPAG